MAARTIGKVAQWRVVNVNSPRHTDNHSCGIFILMVRIHVFAK